MMRSDRRGVALILVLCLLVTLGAIAAQLGRAARLEVGIVRNIRSRTVGRYAAESGLTDAVVQIDALLESLPKPLERAIAFHDLGAHLPSLTDVSLGGARFAVAIGDLNARIDLNRSDPDAVRGLFEQFTTAQKAEIIAASLQAKPLERVGELTALPGVTDALAIAVAPYVTVWSDGMVNINSAPEPVLAALPGIGKDAARSIADRRSAGEVFAPSAGDQQPQGTRIVVAPAPPMALVVTEPSRLLLIARGWQEGSPLTHEIQAVYEVAGRRLVLQAWQERDL